MYTVRWEINDGGGRGIYDLKREQENGGARVFFNLDAGKVADKLIDLQTRAGVTVNATKYTLILYLQTMPQSN